MNDKPANYFVLPLYSQQRLQEIYIRIKEIAFNFPI